MLRVKQILSFFFPFVLEEEARGNRSEARALAD